jgi:hypothetical protein
MGNRNGRRELAKAKGFSEDKSVRNPNTGEVFF